MIASLIYKASSMVLYLEKNEMKDVVQLLSKIIKWMHWRKSARGIKKISLDGNIEKYRGVIFVDQIMTHYKEFLNVDNGTKMFISYVGEWIMIILCMFFCLYIHLRIGVLDLNLGFGHHILCCFSSWFPNYNLIDSCIFFPIYLVLKVQVLIVSFVGTIMLQELLKICSWSSKELDCDNVL